MSYVTNTILAYHTDEPDARIAEVNAFFTLKGFVDVDSPDLPVGWYGGTKMLERKVLLGAFNGLDFLGLVEHLRSLKWEHPNQVQLFVCSGSASLFIEHDID